MQKIRSNVTYANVVSTLALFLALSGGVAFAAAHLTKNSVGASQLRNGAVTEAKIKDGAVTGGKIAAGAITGAQLASGAVGSGQLAPGAVGSAQLGPGVVGSAQLGPEAVGSAQLGPGAVGSAQLGPGAVTADKLSNGSVTGSKFGPGSVSADKLADEAVSSDKLGKNSVNGEKLADGSVTGPKLGNGSVTGEKIADGTVGADKLDAVSFPFSRVVARLRGTTTSNVSAGGMYPFDDPTYTQPAGEDDQYLGDFQIHFFASCATPRSAQASLFVDGESNPIAIGQVNVGGAGGDETVTIPFVEFPSGSGMARLAPSGPTPHTFSIRIATVSCSGKTGGIQMTGARVDVIGTR